MMDNAMMNSEQKAKLRQEYDEAEQRLADMTERLTGSPNLGSSGPPSRRRFVIPD